ncbi:MAG: hypothetical protein KAQ94_03885 [Arcobacteraceae bacterium]|nr:hypothetical protein [Arcobacteraceae bacterium]
MKNSITLKVPNEYNYFKIIKKTIKTLAHKINFNKKDLEQLINASKEIFDNAVEHAYLENHGFIEVDFHLFKYGIRVDIRDWGVPISKHRPKEIIHTTKSGFSRTKDLVNNFRYYNLGKEGKKFSLIKYKLKSKKHKITSFQNIKIDEKDKVDHSNKTIKVRNFQKGDEEGISKLIYENYGHSYIKELFYYPSEILNNEDKKFYSIVALDSKENKLVGHFALLVANDSNIAEIGIAVVSPQYKGLGIMNKMFDALIVQANKLNLDAIYGEAIMYHNFSQKSNASHKFCETALEYGKFPSDIQIKNNKNAQLLKRGSILICYKLLKVQNKVIYLPKSYSREIKKVYDNCSKIKYKIELKKDKPNKTTKIYNNFNPIFNISIIVVDKYGDDFNIKFRQIFQQLQTKHCEVIFVHINLEDIGFSINKIMTSLHQRGFFYSGVLPLFHNNKDYLQLQYHNSEAITDKNVVCYTKYCKKLFNFIKQDKLDKSIVL